MISIRFMPFRALIEATAARYKYDPALLAAQAQQESGFKPEAVSVKGAKGLMQFMPATWQDMGKGKDPFDPEASLDAGVRYMVGLLNQFPDVRLALAAYNHGAGRINGYIRKAGSTAWEKIEPYLPDETKNYVPRILKLRQEYMAAGLLGAAAAPIAGAVLLILVTVILLRRTA